MTKSLLAALPEIILAIGAMSLMMCGVFTQNNPNKKDRQTNSVKALKIVTLSSNFFIIMALASVFLIQHHAGKHYNDLFILDGFAIYVKAFILFCGGMVLLISNDYLMRYSKTIGFEYPLLILLSLCGMMVMVSAYDMLTLYMGLELQSLSLYVLATIRRDSERSSEAGIKYFVLGALASGILLYGISLIYGFSGTTNFGNLQTVLASSEQLNNGLIVGLIMVIVGLAFKISAAPFHMWTPDVYQGVPTPVTAYFAIVPKLAAAALLIRILNDSFGNFVDDWQDVVIIISALSMAIGALAGIWQRNIKRLLAYSSIANMGYALLGLAAASTEGTQGMLIFFIIYMLSSIAIFTIILMITVRSGEGETGLYKISHLNGFAKSHPILALLMALLMFSMIGLPFPPYAGFFGKFFVFKAAIDSGLYGLAVLGVTTSVIAAFYYLKIIKVMYFDELEDKIRIEVARSQHSKLIIFMITVISAIIFIKPALLADLAMNASGGIF